MQWLAVDDLVLTRPVGDGFGYVLGMPTLLR